VLFEKLQPRLRVDSPSARSSRQFERLAPPDWPNDSPFAPLPKRGNDPPHPCVALSGGARWRPRAGRRYFCRCRITHDFTDPAPAFCCRRAWRFSRLASASALDVHIPILERAHASAGVGLSCDLGSPANLSYLDFMVRPLRGVTTTEYPLILGVVAVLMYGTYLALGSSVTSLANGIDSTLTAASRGAAAAESTPKP